MRNGGNGDDAPEDSSFVFPQGHFQPEMLQCRQGYNLPMNFEHVTSQYIFTIEGATTDPTFIAQGIENWHPSLCNPYLWEHPPYLGGDGATDLLGWVGE